MASGNTDGAKAPFLNHYKLEFFQKRFPQTLTGGLRLRIGAPNFIYVNQIIVFLWPVIFGGIFTALTEYGILEDYISCYIFGGLSGLTVIGVHLLRWYLTRDSYTKASQTSGHINVLADDNEAEFSSCCSIETLLFMFPPKSYILIRSVALALLCGMTFLYLLPSKLQDLGYHSSSVVVLLIFNWLTLCIGSHSLSVQPPPEVAIFRSLDDIGLTTYMRPFYVGSIALVGILARHYSSLEEISKALYIVMATLPLLWTIGLLPPLDALFVWLGEQILVFALGGTYMASDYRLLVSLILSVVVLTPACFIANYAVLITYSAALGYLLSLDLFHITNFVVQSMRKTNPRHNLTSTIITIIKYGTLLVICATVAGITSHFNEDATKRTFDSFGYVFVVLLLLVQVLGDLQYVYVGSGLVRNPFYIKSATSVEKLKKFQQKIGYVGLLYNILLSCICPLVMVAFLGTFLSDSKDLSSFAKALGILRALRWAWQNTFKSVLEVAICCVIVWIDIDSTWWNNIGIGFQLMIIGLVTDRFNELLTKIKFLFTVFLTSWREPKQRHIATVPTFIASLVFFPLVFGIVALSVVLSAPLTPLFCFPIFFVGFPRPKRMWPCLSAQISTSSEGSVFYQQLVPRICQELQGIIASGSLLSKSDFHLIRYQDRLIMIHVLERGYNYCTLIARGLELQETSCHTLEAARVDDIFEGVFCKERASAFGFNPYPMHTLTPTKCLVVETYSDARSVLTGVIDQPENIQRQSSNFMRCLVWVLVSHARRAKANNESSIVENPVHGTLDSSKVTEFRDDNVVLQDTTQTMLCESQSGENLKIVSTTQENSSKPEKIVHDMDWSDKEWSDENDSSEDEGEDKRNPVGLESSGGDPLMFFGLPAQDTGSQTRLNSKATQKTEKTVGVFPSRKITPNALDGGARGTPLDGRWGQPSNWRELLAPCKKYLPQLRSKFPEDWFGYVTSAISTDEQAGETSNEDLFSIYRDLAMCCYAVINVCGLHGSAVHAGPAHINRVFQGRVPWSPELDLLEEASELKQLVLKAYRYAFKLSYDEAVLGGLDNDELLETLRDYEQHWFIGIENTPQWNDAILQEKPNLFTIGYDADNGTYTSHLLTKQELPLYAGSLNSEAVNGHWSSLAFELLYLTNDDEERYSIQAHPVLLRNLTMQAADPPLGYAVFSSGPLHLSVTSIM